MEIERLFSGFSGLSEGLVAINCQTRERFIRFEEKGDTRALLNEEIYSYKIHGNDLVIIDRINKSDTVNIPGYLFGVSAGIGSNYGFIGGRIFMGFNNSGLFIGIGGIDKEPLPFVGGRLSHQRVYLALSYAPRSLVLIRDDLVVSYCTVIMAGYLIGINKDRFFVDLGIGYGFSKPNYYYNGVSGYKIDPKGVAFSIGFGVRFNSTE